jgi:divalent metal cation (Fe/Co/Zn/Cd) transporter
LWLKDYIPEWNIFFSVISYAGIRISKRPADTEHPYGQYKAEVVPGFIITIILLLTAVWILYESITSFLSPIQKVIVNHISIGIRVTAAKEKVKIKALKTQKRVPKIFAQLDVILPDNLRVYETSFITKNLEQRLVGSIENLDYVTIQIASHEIGESYYRGIFGRAFGWQRRGRMEKVEGVRALGPGGYCIYPNCGHRIKHEIGIPCSSLKCPKCNANLTREA